MHHTQLNFVVAALLLAAGPALAGTIAKPSKPDQLLDGGPTVACAAGADYAAEADVNGHPVTAADVGDQRLPMPDSIAVPLHRGAQPMPQPQLQRRGQAFRPGLPGNPLAGGLPGAGEGAYVSLDGRRLAPLVNPRPCRK